MSLSFTRAQAWKCKYCTANKLCKTDFFTKNSVSQICTEKQYKCHIGQARTFHHGAKIFMMVFQFVFYYITASSWPIEDGGQNTLIFSFFYPLLFPSPTYMFTLFSFFSPILPFFYHSIFFPPFSHIPFFSHLPILLSFISLCPRNVRR